MSAVRSPNNVKRIGARSVPEWQLKLDGAGTTPRSAAALQNLKKLCETHLAGRYSIEIVDLLVNPQLAAGDQILAVPTLVRKFPEPIRKIIGDLSNEERVLVGLDVLPKRYACMDVVDNKPYVLRLYVTDATPKSSRAIVNARRILE